MEASFVKVLEPYITIETCAWVEYCFALNEKDRKENTIPILNDLEKYYPNYYQKIKIKYKPILGPS